MGLPQVTGALLKAETQSQKNVTVARFCTTGSARCGREKLWANFGEGGGANRVALLPPCRRAYDVEMLRFLAGALLSIFHIDRYELIAGDELDSVASIQRICDNSRHVKRSSKIPY